MPRSAVLVLLAALLTGCAGSTRGVASWSGASGATGTAAPAAAPAPRLSPDVLARVDAARRRAAPDRRTDRFDVSARDSLGSLWLAGETTDADALAALVADLPAGTRSAVRVLPDTAALGPLRYALAAISVVNLRAEPRESAELASQTVLGTPLRLLDRRGGWLLVQTPDRYLGWVDGSTVERVDRASLLRHRDAPKLVVTSLYAWVRAAPDDAAPPVSDLVAGSLLEAAGRPAADSSEAAATHVRVALPDGRGGWVRRADVEDVAAWDARQRLDPGALVSTAASMNGLPYLWGGTSTKGMDCSGFTRTVFLMNGLLLPRDASQQVRAGTAVDSTGDWSRLRPGDLLFFGRKATAEQPERVVHVGMWVGEGRYIHASGRVQVQRLDDPSAEGYNASDRARYLRTKRVDASDPWVRPVRGGSLYDAALR